MTTGLYWLTHLVALVAGASFGAAVMAWMQINRMEHNVEDEILRRLHIKAVLGGEIEPPVAQDCRFPHCACNNPWQKCERKFTSQP
jgi:hypothetical protein